MVTNEPIAAISTPHGRGGIAVIRLSGEGVLEIADRFFRPAGKRKLSEIEGGRTAYGRIYSDGKVIDDGVAAVFCAPRSFTGEDTVEISCHGGIVLSETVLSAALAAGCRLAGAGEFTKRAFLNGKISLSQAEAVINLIDAVNGEGLLLASAQSRGVLSGKIDSLREELTDLIASLYVSVDYPDEDLAPVGEEELRTRVGSLCEALDSLCKSYRVGHAVSEGIPTVIAGRPNTGKSSLLNRILGKERAIVTEFAGTTRDTVEETVSVGRVTLRLCDTAGIRTVSDPVEKIGVEKTRQALREAELILAVFDASHPLTGEDREFLSLLSECRGEVIPVCNKCDLERAAEDFSASLPGEAVEVSAVTGEGLEALYKRISDLFVAEKIDYDTTPILSGARQHAAALSARESLYAARKALDGGFSPDVAGLDLEQALAALAELDGRGAAAEVTDRIFSRFCVGK